MHVQFLLRFFSAYDFAEVWYEKVVGSADLLHLQTHHYKGGAYIIGAPEMQNAVVASSRFE